MISAAAIADTLARKGQAATIAGSTGGSYNPATASATGAAYNASASAVLLPLSPYRAQANSEIIAGDEQMLLPGSIARPPVGAIVTLASGAKYTLIAVDPLHPAGEELLWDCIARGHA